VGVSENVVYPFLPNGFADHYPVFKWLFVWEYSLFSEKPMSEHLRIRIRMAQHRVVGAVDRHETRMKTHTCPTSNITKIGGWNSKTADLCHFTS